jgi:hypothetical protein
MMKSRALMAFLALAALLVSAPLASADQLAISNVETSFDPLACEVTVSWETNKATNTNLVKWDTVPCPLGPTYPNVENAGGGGKNHSVTFSVAAAASPKISFVIESSKPGESASTSCAATTSGPCIAE